MAQLLMPKATAVWLVDNTALTFDQIAKFCGLHPLEVKAIADGESAQGIKGLDPINTGQLAREEIAKAEEDPSIHLTMLEPKVRVPQAKKKSPRYTPVSKRQDRPNAILWLVRNHPELKDAQVSRLVGTTKNTINQVRDRTHWNSANLQPVDPVALGLCSQMDLDFEVQKAAKSMPPQPETETGDALMPASQTEDMPIGLDADAAPEDAVETAEAAFANFDKQAEPTTEDEDPEIDADNVFAKLKALKGDIEGDGDVDANADTDN